jgi:hypothetical protein
MKTLATPLANGLKIPAPGPFRDVQVAIGHDGAVLTGATESWHAKQLAQEAVLQSGVTVRANRIVVRPPSS